MHADVPGDMRVRRSKRRTTRRLSLLVRFAIISFVLLCAVGVVLARWLNANQHDRRLAEAASSAQIVAQAGLQGQLVPADLDTDFRPLATETRAALDQAFGSAISEDGVVRLKIWNQQRWIVYSDNPLLVGRWFPGDDGLSAALGGEVSSMVTDLARPEEMEERVFGRLLAVYVPIRQDESLRFTNAPAGEVIGAFEIYVSYEPIADAIAEDARNLSLALAISFLVLYLGLFRLVAGASRRLRTQSAENAHQAAHDALTDLPNRRQLVADLQVMLDRRGGSKYVALALLDIDRFKEINDALGHPSGDKVLIDIASRFREQMPDATVARIGGDEFAIAAENLPHAQAALAVASRIEQVLEAPFDVAGISVSVRPSIGISLGPDDGRSAEELLQHADVAMYVAKRTGVGRQLYSRNLDHYSQDRLELAGELRDAIATASGEVMLAYQPKLDLVTDEVLGVECLVRWKHPQRGFVPPAEFLPIIENTELIAPLTWLVLDQALATCAKWRRHGLEIQMAVNISARTISSSELYDQVVAALDRHGLPPSSLELEITETALLGDHHLAASNVTRFRELGVDISIDDFGTGYASIGYLTTMPISAVKIDRSFVSDMFSDPAAAAVVNFSVGLGQQLGLQVVAEGIEDEPTLEELRRLGVNTGQGYFISRPMPATEFLHWLLAWSTRHLTPHDVAPEIAPETAPEIAAGFDSLRTDRADADLVDADLVGAGVGTGTGSVALHGSGNAPAPLPAPRFDLSPYAADAGLGAGGSGGSGGSRGSGDWGDTDAASDRWSGDVLTAGVGADPWPLASTSGPDETEHGSAVAAALASIEEHRLGVPASEASEASEASNLMTDLVVTDLVVPDLVVPDLVVPDLDPAGADASPARSHPPLTLTVDPADRTGVGMVFGTQTGGGTLEWTPGPSAPSPIPLLRLSRADDNGADGTPIDGSLVDGTSALRSPDSPDSTDSPDSPDDAPAAPAAPAVPAVPAGTAAPAVSMPTGTGSSPSGSMLPPPLTLQFGSPAADASAGSSGADTSEASTATGRIDVTAGPLHALDAPETDTEVQS